MPVHYSQDANFFSYIQLRCGIANPTGASVLPFRNTISTGRKTELNCRSDDMNKINKLSFYNIQMFKGVDDECKNYQRRRNRQGDT